MNVLVHQPLPLPNVRVTFGANDSYFEIVGDSVASVRRALRTGFNIPSVAEALVNGMAVDPDHLLWPGDHLEFVRRWGCKGVSPQKNTIESQRIKKLIRAKKGRCYSNSFRVIQTVPGYESATYVEGMAVLLTGGIRFPFEHGWVEKDGEIIDSTIPTEECAYFVGLCFVGQRGLASALTITKPDHTKEDLPIFYRFGWGGSGSPEFSQARKQAERLAFGEADRQPFQP